MSEFSALLSCSSGHYSGSKDERLLNNIFFNIECELYMWVCI